jgi:hypothetical protein
LLFDENAATNRVRLAHLRGGFDWNNADTAGGIHAEVVAPAHLEEKRNRVLW